MRRPVTSLLSILMILSACAPNSNGPSGSSFEGASTAETKPEPIDGLEDFDEDDPLGGWEEVDQEQVSDATDEEESEEGTDAPPEQNIVENEKEVTSMFENTSFAAGGNRSEKERNSLGSYGHVDPNGYVPRDLLVKALNYFDANKSRFKNKRVIGVIDYSKHSSKRRFFLIDLRRGDVVALHVAHGKGSDRDDDGYAERFSNTVNSKMTSLGFYRGAEVYHGKHGLSLRLDGLSVTNSAARRRAVVIHSATYVAENRSKQGRSWGCPAVTSSNRNRVINALRNGTMILADRSEGKLSSREVPRVQKIPRAKERSSQDRGHSIY